MDGHSPDAYGVNSDEHGEQWEHDDGQDGTSEPPSPSGAIGSQKSAGPLQKRRRVTRACDECRRKKIKCDGKQPCTHCTVYSYECSYDQPSNRRRNPAPQYIESLEGRVHRAEALLHMIIPNLDLNDPAIHVAVQQGFIPGLKSKMPSDAAERLQQRQNAGVNASASELADVKDTNLESMVRAVGQLDVDENGHWDFHGHSSGLSFVRRMREQLGDIMGPETGSTPFLKTRPLSHVFDSPRSASYESPYERTSFPTALPSEDVARELCTNSVIEGASLLRCVHLPSYWRSFKRIYSLPPELYADEDQKFLPLLYSTLALGKIFGKDEANNFDQVGYETTIDEGFKYFKAARQMMDIADCRDIPSLQAIIFMIFFLQSSSRLSQCYAYIGVALRSALRMGLHRVVTTRRFNPLEADVRKRVFWTIRKMDIYVGAILGLPQTLSDEDIDQDFPAEVDDELITQDGISPQPEGRVCIMTAFNVHTRLVSLLTKIVRNVYPIRVKSDPGSAEKTYTVPFSVIRDIESDLERWINDLPVGLTPSHPDPRLTRAQQLLRLAYAFAQVLLYRPFLHFVATDKRSRHVDQRAYTCAASYVNVSRNIIHLCTQMKQTGLLNGSFWFIMYTTFFSILSLVYFAAENPNNATAEAVMKDALEGREVLKLMAKRSMAADRCTATLDEVFNRLPDWLREGRQNPVTSRKRRQESLSKLTPQASRSHPDIGAAVRETTAPSTQPRASTFPKSGAILPKIGTTGYDSQLSMGAQTQSALSNADLYTPASGTATGAPTTFPQMDGSWGGGLMPPYNMTPEYLNPDLPDLSSMMFPSAEPFMYPNQPLTTFENNQYDKGVPLFNNMNGFDSSAPLYSPRPASNPDQDNMEAQFYSLPPYMVQQDGQQQPWGLNVPRQTQQSGSASDMQTLGSNWNGQVLPPVADINLNDIFGSGEWNSILMDPKFR